MLNPLCEAGFSNEAWRGINALMGAGLGACFYILVKTQPYLVNRSYDPKYNAAYFSRFITGLIGGLILATVLNKALEGGQLGQNGVVAFTPGVLAILGGYAAEAVEQILQRMADILLSVIRGDGSAEVKARAAMAQGEKNAAVRGKLVELEAARDDPQRFKSLLTEAHASLKTESS